MSPSVLPSTSTASTSTPSNFPSLSPSAVFNITTIAGTGTQSDTGDNGQATAAAMYSPMGIALDSSGTRSHDIDRQQKNILILSSPRQRVYC